MAKRFIDTGLFDDDWFSELSTECKLFWLYYLTKCDHAGLLKFNKKLIEFQTGIKSLDTVLKHFDNRLVRVNDSLFFCPKFIQFQYPDFPKSTVRQQASAIELLIKNGIWDVEKACFKDLTNSYQTVNKDLNKSYGHVNGHVNGENNKESKIIFPFTSQRFTAAWETWKTYRRQIKKPYKTDLSEQAALKKLSKYTEEQALEMIEQSIANQWQGIFEVTEKTKPNGTTKTRKETPADLAAAFAERVSQDAANRQFSGSQ